VARAILPRRGCLRRNQGFPISPPHANAPVNINPQ